MNILQKIFKEHYDEIVYILRPRKSIIENVNKMINCGDRQPIKFCVNNNPSSNKRILDCGAIRLSDLPRVNFSFLSAECYARLV